MSDLSFHEKQHIQRLLKQEGSIKYIFDEFVRKAGLLMSKWTEQSQTNVWLHNAALEKKIDKLLVELHGNLTHAIEANITTAWNASNKKTDDLVSTFIKDLAISDTVKNGMFVRNAGALQSFVNRKVDGLTVSDRVWDIAGGTKQNLEYYLSSGVSSGRSAASISRDVRQLLQNSDRRFRRVRNEDGKLVMSKPMAAYNPGRGVYRSSYKNALRLAGTETNAAYRAADHERWKNIDFIVGIEIKRSPANRGACPMCDALADRYPKNFKFVGWHPQCWCIAVPVMLEGEEFTEFLITGKISEERMIRSLPAGMQKYISDNEERILKASEPPFWVRDNFIDGDIRKGIIGSQTGRQKDAFLYDKIVKTENAIRMNKTFETAVVFDQEGNVLINKDGSASYVSFTKEELPKMKDAVLTHNHPCGWKFSEKSVRHIGSSFSKEDISLAINNDLAEVRAVTPLYTYVMKRPPDGWGMLAGTFTEEYNKFNSNVQKEFYKIITNSTDAATAIQRAESIHYHVLWKRLSKEHGIEYTKEKTR
jgi:hypothetical protein